MPSPTVTRMVEDYLTLIWKTYEWPGGQPSTTDIAANLGVTPSSVSANLKKLARDGYLDYEPYGNIELTDSGRAIAVGIVRRHRILETYLAERLGLTWDQVHDEADRLEHAVSDLVLDRMDEVLGHPTSDPHGDPIPAVDGTVARVESLAFAEASPGMVVEVLRVSDRSPDVLRYLHEHGITVGARLTVVDVREAAATIRVVINGEPAEISLQAAAAVRVVPPTRL